METVNDPRFGIIHIPQSISDLFEYLLDDSKGQYHVHMWRGQADASWALNSGAHRREALSKYSTSSEDSIRRYERRLMDRATHRGFRFSEGRQLSDFELLGKLQHFGAATRLLDTTRNVAVALFFACRSLPEIDGMLFGIHVNNLGGGEDELLNGTYDEIMTNMVDGVDHPITWTPPLVSPRVAAQHSQFIFGRTVKQSHGSIPIEDPSKYLLAIRIPKALKAAILIMVRSLFDITESSMFPDLEGFARRESADLEEFPDARW